jgi:hypothetical protein
VGGTEAIYAACAALLLTGAYPLLRAWQANRDTTLRQAVVWAACAWAAWAASAAARAAWPQDHFLWQYLPLCFTAGAGVAVLGARRPGVRAWNFVVLGLMAVLLLPALGGADPQPRLELAPVLFLSATLAVALINYLPTPSGWAAVIVGAACAGEVAVLAGWLQSGVWEAVLLVGLAVAPWAGLAASRRARGATEFDRAWRAFRDRYGLVWGLRVCDQFNRAAANARWPVVLRWDGLRATPGAAPDLRAPTAGLHALLKRFGPEERQ